MRARANRRASAPRRQALRPTSRPGRARRVPVVGVTRGQQRSLTSLTRPYPQARIRVRQALDRPRPSKLAMPVRFRSPLRAATSQDGGLPITGGAAVGVRASPAAAHHSSTSPDRGRHGRALRSGREARDRPAEPRCLVLLGVSTWLSLPLRRWLEVLAAFRCVDRPMHPSPSGARGRTWLPRRRRIRSARSPRWDCRYHGIGGIPSRPACVLRGLYRRAPASNIKVRRFSSEHDVWHKSSPVLVT
jgi:hypothetical protein